MPRQDLSLALYRQPVQENPGNVELLANASPEIAAKLCPALLWLFGDAEPIGDIYQIADQRLRIAALIKHLWDAPVHRAAFRTIVADVRAFVTFANGLLNETNKLVAGAIERLPEIRNHQVRTGLLDASNDEFRRLRAEYESANDTRREELDSRHSEHEQHLKQDLELCTEILSLVEMLTGDTAVKAPHGRGAALQRACCGGAAFRGETFLDIKISNPDAYGFDPTHSRSGANRVLLRGRAGVPGAW